MSQKQRGLKITFRGIPQLDGSIEYYWVRARKEHGPFKTQDEAINDAKLVLFGPDVGPTVETSQLEMIDESSKREKMIARLYDDFPPGALVVAMAQVFQQRRERAGMEAPFRSSNPMELLEEFLATLNVEQLKIFRKIAKSVGPGKRMLELEIPDEVKQVEEITEVVKPPTAH
jgi:hypothetical protein